MQQIKVYITAKREHASKILAAIPDGIHCNARWPYMQHTGQRPTNHWLHENFDDAIASHFIVFYVQPEDKLKTSLLELGNACAYNKKIFIATSRAFVEDQIDQTPLPHRDLEPWVGLDNIKIIGTLEQTFKYIKAQVHEHEMITKAGKVKV